MPASTGSADRALLACFVAIFAQGCGGATPLLHPAHTLAPGKVSFGAGASGTFVAGNAKTRLHDARGVSDPGGTLTDAERGDLGQGTAVSVLATPGLAPWLGARVGVAERTEAGAAYTGRWARIDVRHALEDRKLALSFGIAGLGLHPSADPGEPAGTSGAIAGVDTDGVWGFGVNVPVLVGYRSDAELVQAWGGLIGTFEHALGPVLLANANDPNQEVTRTRLEATRFSGAAVVGLAVGLEPVWVAVEVAGRYFSLEASLNADGARSRGSLDGVSIEPAGAVIGRF